MKLLFINHAFDSKRLQKYIGWFGSMRARVQVCGSLTISLLLSVSVAVGMSVCVYALWKRRWQRALHAYHTQIYIYRERADDNDSGDVSRQDNISIGQSYASAQNEH